MVCIRLADPVFVESVRLRYFDQLITSKESTVSEQVHVVNIDDEFIKQKGQFPFPRAEYAKIIEDLYKRNAGLVVFNVYMPDTDRFHQDDTLANTLKKYPVVLPQSATTDNSLTTLLARATDGTIKLLTTSTISGSKPSTLNKYETTTGTTVGDNYNTGVRLSGTPVTSSYVGVEINGLGVNVGDGITTRDCYFSSNGTAGGVRTFSTVTTGDYLVWNTVIAGYDLDNTDIITILYNT